MLCACVNADTCKRTGRSEWRSRRRAGHLRRVILHPLPSFPPMRGLQVFARCQHHVESTADSPNFQSEKTCLEMDSPLALYALCVDVGMVLSPSRWPPLI